MFKRKTLFIVGAGASAELELPVGAALAKRIARLLTVGRGSSGNPEGEQLLSQLYSSYPLNNEGYHIAARTISGGVVFANSIDDFLDRHSDDELIQRVGKAAIVKSILAAERESLLIKSLHTHAGVDALDKTWYMKFFRMLGSRVSASNARQIFDNVAFIVFNYDRCLEEFLVEALQLVYNMRPNEADAVVSDCQIIHPYGVISDFFDPAGIQYGGRDGVIPDYVRASAGVKILSEQMAAGELLQDIHAHMIDAEQIVFLGFGYLEENMTMLRPAAKMNLKPVFGTAFEMSESSIDEVKNRLAELFSGDRNGILPAMLISNQKCGALFDYYTMRLPS
jgi:hypothetical protein